MKLRQLTNFGLISISSSNYEVYLFLEKEVMETIDYLANEAARIGNILFVKYFFEKNRIPKNILVLVSESGNIELVKLIINQGKININAKEI